MVRTDSRQVLAGDTFVAVDGVAADGADFALAAIAAGASRIVSERPRPSGLDASIEWIQVPDSRASAAKLAAEDAGKPSEKIDVFAVTGTNGKTTVANLLRLVLEACGKPCGLISTVENDLFPLDRSAPVPSVNTTPGPVELQGFFKRAAENGCAAISMEASSHALDQKRMDCTRVRCAIFTNLTQDHLDYHKTLERYFEAKSRLFFELAPETAAVNIDDPCGVSLFNRMPRRGTVLSYGFNPDADVRIEAASFGASSSTFHLRVPGENRSVEISSRLMGRHNALNVAAAFAAALATGCNPDTVARALCAAQPVRGRLEPVSVAVSPSRFFVDYAHTPDALENVLRTLREITKGRLIVVFGAGGDRDRSKRPKMGAACARMADTLVVTSDNPRSEDPDAIIRDIRRGIPDSSDLFIEPDRRAALHLAATLATSPDDIVLVAGKGHETYQIFADRTEHFDDREELLLLTPENRQCK